MALERLGLVKTTLIDYPGEVASTLFTAGCNLRCPYCHNPELLHGSPPKSFVPAGFILEFLEKRRSVLGGVCITGGEPLLHPEIGILVESIRALGLKVKIDTNGTFPERLQELKTDYIAMDIKTVPERYGELAPVNGKSEKLAEDLEKSIVYIMKHACDYEFRTTVIPSFVDEEVIEKIAVRLKGARRYILTPFNPENTYDMSLRKTVPPSTAFMERLRQIASSRVPTAIR